MTRSIPATSTGSLLGGLWFVFQHEGHQLALWVSSFSGKEEVFVDGLLVATRRKISLSSSHSVLVNAEAFTLSLSVVSLKAGVFQATLERSGKKLQGWTSRYVTRSSMLISVAPFAVLAALAFSLFNDSAPWYTVYLVALAALGLLAWATRGQGYGFVVEPMARVEA